MAIESRDHIPTVDFIKGKLIEEEARRQGSDTKEDGATSALITKKAHTNKGPSTYKHRGTARGEFDKKKFDGDYYNCGKYGHPASRCRIKRKDGGKANKVEKIKGNEKEDSLIAISALNCSAEKDEWYLDSGATAHMCNNRNAFESLSNGPLNNVSTAGKENLMSHGIGDIRFNVRLRGKVKSVKLTNVLYVPELRNNLLSVPVITEKNYEVKFSKNNAYIIRSDKSLVFKAIKRKRIYVVKQIKNQGAFNVSNNSDLKLKLWHERYGHLNYNDLKELFDKGRVYGLDLPLKSHRLLCETCDRAKIHVLPFTEATRTKKILELVHTDICGPM